MDELFRNYSSTKEDLAHSRAESGKNPVGSSLFPPKLIVPSTTDQQAEKLTRIVENTEHLGSQKEELARIADAAEKRVAIAEAEAETAKSIAKAAKVLANTAQSQAAQAKLDAARAEKDAETAKCQSLISNLIAFLAGIIALLAWLFPIHN